jgi:hypothetical protein
MFESCWAHQPSPTNAIPLATVGRPTNLHVARRLSSVALAKEDAMTPQTLVQAGPPQSVECPEQISRALKARQMNSEQPYFRAATVSRHFDARCSAVRAMAASHAAGYMRPRAFSTAT